MDVLRPIRLRLGDAELAGSLVEFLRSAGCLALKVEPDVVEAQLPAVAGERRDRDELLAYVAMWMGMQDGLALLQEA
jgi:hypothetical protein